MTRALLRSLLVLAASAGYFACSAPERDLEGDGDGDGDADSDLDSDADGDTDADADTDADTDTDTDVDADTDSDADADGSVTCWANVDCGGGAYCETAPGDCGGAGSCEPRPDGCGAIWAPVCGCDGDTYGNACGAAAAGVGVAYDGECEPGGCGSNADCGESELCLKDVGDCDGRGVCERAPEACDGVYEPVCGCDGETYSNACIAAGARVNVAHEGECAIGGCLSNGDCADGFYCERGAADCSGMGACQVRPEDCPDVWSPVCGCDGDTYGNRCEAAAAAVSVAHDGACTGAGCDDNLDCPDAEYCSKDVGACLAAGVSMGVCETRPARCDHRWDPVCGCDGVSYENPCHAALEGTSVAVLGLCPEEGCSSNGDCEDWEYCHGECDGDGLCAARPGACPDVWAPVCGCDGVTYGNACEAAHGGANVSYEGECEVGDGCTSNEGCPDAGFCAKEVGNCDGEGWCDSRPMGCFDIWAPVCGCDWTTYGNDCQAAAAGVPVAHEGECG